jgi:hypothetical protein
MDRHLLRPFVLLILLAACTSDPTPKPLPADRNTLTFERNLYFQTSQGTDTVLAPGEYQVRKAGSESLEFLSSDGQSVTVEAKAFFHDLPVHSHFALLVPHGEEDNHAVLLLPDGIGLDAIGSASAIRSRATLQTLQATNLQMAVHVQPQFQAIGFLDPCAGASSSSAPSGAGLTTMTPVRQTNVPSQLTVPNPGSGPGPIADVTDWQPRTRVSAAGTIVIRGRDLDPNRLIVRIGDSTLTKTGSSSGEVRFQAPGSAQSSGKPLVVYHQGGQARTLDPTYLVFNPAVLITRVVPAAFAQGDLVTVCGQSLFHAGYSGPLANPAPNPNVALGPSNPLQTVTESFGRLGDNFVHMITPAVSPTGDRMTFVAGDLYRGQGQSTAGGGVISYILAVNPQPMNKTGEFQFAQPGKSLLGGPYVSGPSATWRLGGPKITKVYADPFRQFGVQEAFVILPTILPDNTVYNNRMAIAHVEGGNLNGQFRIGNLSIPSYSVLSSDGTKIGLQIPANASTAPICGTRNNVTGCSSAPFAVVPGPVLSSMPAVPLTVLTTHTINGLNLLPAGVNGLTYRFTITGLDPASASSTVSQCNLVLYVLEHSGQRIRFRIGDPGAAPPPSFCQSANPNMFALGTNSPTMFLTASFADKPPFTLFHQKVHLVRPASTTP